MRNPRPVLAAGCCQPNLVSQTTFAIRCANTVDSLQAVQSVLHIASCQKRSDRIEPFSHNRIFGYLEKPSYRGVQLNGVRGFSVPSAYPMMDRRHLSMNG